MAKLMEVNTNSAVGDEISFPCFRAIIGAALNETGEPMKFTLHDNQVTTEFI